MRKLALIGFVALIIMCPVFAYTYSASITVTESAGVSYTELPIILRMDNQELVDSGFIDSTGLDVRIRSGNTTLPHMLVDDRTLFSANITASTQETFLYTIGNDLASSTDILVGRDGLITAPDSDYIELGSSFSVNISGFINTDNASDKWLFGKDNAFRLFINEYTSERIISHIDFTTQTSPTGSEDPSGNWTGDANAYDDDTDTSANYTNLPAGNWSDYLNLTHSSLRAWKARHYVSVSDNASITEIDMDYYLSTPGTWHDIYQGSFVKDAWESHSFPLDVQDDVTKLRVRFHNEGASSEDIYVKEIDFGQTYFVYTSGSDSADYEVIVTTDSSNMSISLDNVIQDSITWTDNVSVPDNSEDNLFMRNDAMSYAHHIRISRVEPVGTINDTVTENYTYTTSDMSDQRIAHATSGIYIITSGGMVWTVWIDADGDIDEVSGTIDSLNCGSGTVNSPAINVAGSVYAHAFRGGSYNILATYSVNSQGEISDSTLDTLNLSNTPSSPNHYPHVAKIDQNGATDLFAVAYTDGGDSDSGHIKTVTIDTLGNISDTELDSHEWGISNKGTRPFILDCSGNLTALIGSGETTLRGYLHTLEIAPDGAITPLYYNIFDGTQYEGGTLHRIDGNYYVIFYTGGVNNNRGCVKTANFDGTGDPTYPDSWDSFTSASYQRCGAVELGDNMQGTGKVYTTMAGPIPGGEPELQSIGVSNTGVITKSLIDTQDISAENLITQTGGGTIIPVFGSLDQYVMIAEDAGPDNGLIFTWQITTDPFVTQLLYQPNTMVIGNTLEDLSGYNVDGTITWGSNPSGITVALGGLIPEAEAVAAEVVVSDVPDFVPPTEELPDVVVTGIEGENLPFYGMFKGLLEAWENLGGPNIPMPYFWKIVAVIIAWVIGTAVMLATRQVFIGIVAYITFFAIPAGAMGGILDLWVPIVYGIGAICVSLLVAKWGHSTM